SKEKAETCMKNDRHGAQGAQSLAESPQSDHAERLTDIRRILILRRHCASMAESVDAADSKSAVGNNVRVRVSLEAPSSFDGRPIARRMPTAWLHGDASAHHQSPWLDIPRDTRRSDAKSDINCTAARSTSGLMTVSGLPRLLTSR